LKARLASAVQRLDPQLLPAAVVEAVHVATTPMETGLARNKPVFHRLLIDGVKLEFTNAASENDTDYAQLIDFQNSKNNDFLAVQSWYSRGT
jgi:type I restriction enzyme R subunit